MIAITGYASLDHVAMLDGTPRAGRTTTILDRPENAWPRLGGGPAYVAAALVANGVAKAHPVSWIGDDEAGETYRRQLALGRIPDDGLAIVPGARTPVSILAYEPDGGCICLYDPGMPKGLTLTEAQRDLVGRAEWVCVMIGPPDATAAVLEAIGPKTKLAWVVKHDPRAMSAELAGRLAARANLICCSHAERAFVDEVLPQAGLAPGQMLIETQGAKGAAMTRDGTTVSSGTAPITVDDPTGAGDTFAGGVLAALAGGETEPARILDAGHRAAAALLRERRTIEMESA